MSTSATEDETKDKQLAAVENEPKYKTNAENPQSSKTRIQELEKKLEKEHALVVEFQKKLTQAGTHLKSLTLANGNLTKSLNEEKAKYQKTVVERNELEKKYKGEEDTLQSKMKVLEEELKLVTEGHQKEVRQLVELIEEITDTFDEDNSKGKGNKKRNIPDVSTANLLDTYLKSVQKKLKTFTEADSSKDDKKHEECKERIEELQKQLEELKSEDHIPAFRSALESILKDPENGTIDSSIPPSILILIKQLQDTLQEQQEQLKKASDKNRSIVEEAQKDLKRQITHLNITINDLNEEKEKVISEKEEIESQLEQVDSLQKRVTELEEALAKTEKAKEESESREKQLSKEHQSLLSKLSHIKETLTPRLEQDKQLRQRVSELSKQLDEAKDELERCRSDMLTRDEINSHQIEKKDHVIAQLSSRLDSVQQEREEYELMNNQLDAELHRLREEIESSQAEYEQLRVRMEIEKKEHESERASLANLQTVLEEFQATKDAEMQTAVGYIARQLEVAKKAWAEYEERAHTAETALAKYQQNEGRAEKYEQEIKEKNLLIGKLRHEAIILNEHLVEAMRKLKEGASESNVDRQLITNLLIGFFNAPRGDRKRYDILSIIASVLQLTDEQKEQVGLIRPKNGSLANHHLPLGTPVSPTIEPQKESFTDAWISFLLKESSPLRRNRSAVSLSSTTTSDDHNQVSTTASPNNTTLSPTTTTPMNH